MNKGVENIVNKVELMFESNKTDAVNLLKTDHRKVEMLINKFLSSRSSNKRDLVNKIVEEISIHSKVEEELVYPILENSDKEKISLGAEEAEEEHRVLKMALEDLSHTRGSKQSKQLRAKMMVVRELVKHHVKEEETKLLPELKRSGIDLELLGQQIQARKEQLKRRASKGKIRSTLRKASKPARHRRKSPRLHGIAA